jgi:hypothetical protein
MKGDSESKGIDLVIMWNVWDVRHKLMCLWQIMSIEFVVKYAPMNISVLYDVQNLHTVTCFCSCSQSNFEIFNYVELVKQSQKWKVFKHETYMKASQLGSLKLLLAANLEQRNLVQLCHISSLCPL